jgi:acyl dehydratase
MSPVTTPTSIDDLEALAGIELGPAGWREITQALVSEFAALTLDEQWIHTDPERASGTALGGTIAHGLFTLALGPRFTEELLAFDAFAHVLNYGYDKVRFPAPMPVGQRVRMRLTIEQVTRAAGGAQVSLSQEFEAEGVEKPVCVASALARFFEGDFGVSTQMARCRINRTGLSRMYRKRIAS